MNRVSIAFLTKDRPELSRQTVLPLLQPDKFNLFWVDGSVTDEGKNLPGAFSIEAPQRRINIQYGIRGGPDAAVVYALSLMLAGSDNEYVGIVENDVLLEPDWFERTMALFERGPADGLEAGAVSARCYEDRILIQRDGYAVCHNLGWGMQIVTRQAAQIALAFMRTSLTTENRKLFSQLSDIDIGSYWAFRGSEHMLVADWGNDRVLASHGLASLALTPSPVQMIGQNPPLEQQGLKVVTGSTEICRDEGAFRRYVHRTADIRAGIWMPPVSPFLYDQGHWLVFPHQVPMLGGIYKGDWKLKWTQGYGPFSWKAGHGWRNGHAGEGASRDAPMMVVPIAGPAEFMVGGGEQGGQVRLEDTTSGFTCEPVLQPEGPNGQILSVLVPGTVGYRGIKLTALTPGVTFYGLKTRDQQPWLPGTGFDHATLPPA